MAAVFTGDLGHRMYYVVAFPQIMLAMCIMWLLCFILTVVDVFPSDKTATGYWARTDVRTDAIVHSPWFRLPYPGTLCLTQMTQSVRPQS